MFKRVFLLYIFVLFGLSALLSQEVVTTTDVKIQWKGIETWTAGQNTKKVLSFANAVFPDESPVPAFNKRFSIDPGFDYSVSIDNKQFIPLTAEETEIATQYQLQNTDILPSTAILKSAGNSYLDLIIKPFVLNNGVISRLSAFQMQVLKTPKAKKVKSNGIHSYASNSVLASGKFVKIAIKNTGVYRLTYEDLNAMGISPANVRIFGYGGEVLDQDFSKSMPDDLPELTIHMEKGGDGVFNSGDYILFYAKGINKWNYDRSRDMFVHTINSYSTKGYYFVTSDAGTGRKIDTKSITVPSNSNIVPIEDFTDYLVHENESFTLSESGKELYGERFGETTTYNYVFNFPNIIKTNSTKIRLDVVGSSSTVSTYSLSLDDAQTKSLSVSKRTDGDVYEKGKGANGTFTFTPTRDALNLKLTYNLPSSSSWGHLNFMEINVQRALTMSGAYMPFQNTSQYGTSNYCQYKLSDAGANVQIWDVTDPQNISRMATQTIDGKMSFTATGGTVNNYVAIDPGIPGAFAKPEIIGAVANQNLHAMPQAEMIIITHPNFVTQAAKIAEAHNTIDGLRVNVMTSDQVYNEFSSGTPDATAYRRAVKMFYDRALDAGNAGDLPKYLLLFGRGTYDNRKLISTSGDNLLLTYQADNSLVQTVSYVTDDYFGFLDDNEGVSVPSNVLDVGIGRFSVATTAQADDVVNKTIAYMQNSNKGKWKNQLCFVADDGDNALHMGQADSITRILARNFKSYNINKIYLDAYNQEISASGETYPVARKQLQDLLRKGLLYLNYTGHAGTQGWANENVLTVNDVSGMSNRVLPVWVGATCDFLQFDLKTVSAGEKVVLNPDGGGIGILSAARPVYASQNFNVNRYFTENLFKKVNGKHYRIGDVVALAKNSVGSEINKLSYVYLGDPAVQLAYPTDYNVATTLIQDANNITTDTLKAMAVIKVNGEIRDDNNQLVNSFNGSVSVDVFDKIQRLTTQNNHGDGGLIYSDRPNVLYSGKTIVKDGKFSFTFMLPKDIKYNYGGGKINYYATSNDDDSEAQGYYEDFTVGGTGANVVYETSGPDINLYLNSTNFKDGDAVNETPVLIADISDPSGINKVGSGIGHDLLITIDNDPSMSYVVNDFFEADQNSYTSGSLSYKLSTLSEGKHSLTFKAWDLLNNSALRTIEFEVINGLQPVIFKVYNYPNPVSTNTQIVVEHDRPETILTTKVEIFDLSGRKIWEFSQNNADNIVWDRRGSDGIKVKSGIYFYKVNINTTNSEVYSKTNKMLITGE